VISSALEVTCNASEMISSALDRRSNALEVNFNTFDRRSNVFDFIFNALNSGSNAFETISNALDLVFNVTKMTFRRARNLFRGSITLTDGPVIVLASTCNGSGHRAYEQRGGQA